MLRIHQWLYQRTGGRVGHRLPGTRMPALLLHTTGARSGLPRTNALTYVPDGDRMVVIASNGGADRHPAWFHNLRAHPEAEVHVGPRRLRVRAREAQGDERERFFEEANRLNRDRYRGYQARTVRRIPVVVLEPVDG